MKVWIKINPATALLAGKAKSGILPVDLSSEQIGSLTAAELAQIAKLPGLGDDTPPARPAEMGMTEPTADELLRAIRERLAEAAKIEEANAARRQQQRDTGVANEIASLRKIVQNGTNYRNSLPFKEKPDGTLAELWSDLPLTEDETREVRDLWAKVREIADQHDTEAWIAWIAKRDEGGAIGPIAPGDRAPGSNLRRDELETRGLYAAAEMVKVHDEACEARNRARRQAEEDLKALRARSLCEAVEQWGTAGQIERLNAGVLPADEAQKIMRDGVFAPLASWQRYRQITAREIFASLLRDHQHLSDAVEYTSDLETELSDAQWSDLKQIRALMPDATVEARYHFGGLRESDEWQIKRWSAKVTMDWRGWTLTREYAIADQTPIESE